jgi:hypothetical protein
MLLDVLEQECGTSRLLRFAPPDSRRRLSPHVHLRDAICDFGDFENGINFGLNALQLAGAVEGGDPLTEVVEGQGFLSRVTDDYKGFAAAESSAGCTPINTGQRSITSFVPA